MGLIAILLIGIFKKFHLRDTEKTLIILASGMLLTSLEDILKNIVPIASLLGVMVRGFVLLDKYPKVANRISEKFNKVWVFAEILLFVLVGARSRCEGNCTLWIVRVISFIYRVSSKKYRCIYFSYRK